MKAGMKQQNLFGQTIVEDLNKGPGAKGKKKPVGKEKSKADSKKKSESPVPDVAGGRNLLGKRSTLETQDLQMEDDSQTTSGLDSQVHEVETQLEETQLDGSSPPADTEVETQPATETQTEEEETQLETQVDEDNDEPVCVSPEHPVLFAC